MLCEIESRNLMVFRKANYANRYVSAVQFRSAARVALAARMQQAGIFVYQGVVEGGCWTKEAF